MNQVKLSEKIEKVKPLFNKVIVTANEIKVGNIVLAGVDDKTLDEIQTVVRTGPGAYEHIKEGSKVKIDYTRYTKLKNSNYKDKIQEEYILLVPHINTIEGRFLLIDDRDIEYIIEK